MNAQNLSPRMVLIAVVCAVWLVALPAAAVTIEKPAVQGAGFVTVDPGCCPTILGAPAGMPLNVDVVFENMDHVELMDGATTNIEFGVGNHAGNNADLEYHITFDLSDMAGNLITTDALTVDGAVSAGDINAHNLDLTPLPPVIFHDFHVKVETMFKGPNTGSGLFDLYIAGGGGDDGTVVSGPVRFNRAIVGKWIPEPSAAILALLALTALSCGRMRSTFR